jgi:ElaB/YqjD/DUF883 family membrane-anchored ribosome-binding protein
MSTTFERATTPAPGPTPADAAAQAARADERAAQAKAVAENAEKIAKDARKAAGESTREAAKLREVADPKLRDRPNLSTAQAKVHFLEAANAIDPIGSLRNAVRNHPFMTVGAALGAGAVVGASTGKLGPISRFAYSLIKLAKPLALSAAQLAASRVAAHYAADAASAAPPPAAGKGTG